LTLWSFGARSFAVSGQARLAKELAISQRLLKEGFNVPKIMHVSNAERIIFLEYIEGESLNEAIKRYGNNEEGDKVLSIISKVGETLARVHSHDITLGDSKPDNVIVKADGSIYLIDFEQAQQGGDKAWDIAVFLYYCGHYLQPIDGPIKGTAITNAFNDYYLKAGGSLSDIHKAALPKYTRVFSIFTLPLIVLAISNACKKAKNPTISGV
jgi:Kae1-associated kinase Bud32